MTQQVNELGVLGLSTVPAMYDISMASAEPDQAQASTAEIPAVMPEVVSVYVVSAEVVNGCSTPGDDSAMVDLVLNVCVNGDGAYSTYKVVKRLCMSRAKLAAEAKNCEVVCVEEKLSEEQVVVNRLRDMIGR